MAVELSKLYKEIYSEYEVELLTNGCFGKKIRWIHMMEDRSFAYLLHGDELIFNSRLNYDSEKGLRDFIDCLLEVKAGGLVVAAKEKSFFTDEIIEYCNDMKFPLFFAGWETAYIDIMHRFSEIIISDERNETNLIAALKNAIFYPDDDKLYQNHFERNGYFQKMSYVITILGSFEKRGVEYWKRIEKSIQYALPKSVAYEEQGMLIVLTVGYECERLREELKQILLNDSSIHAAIGVAKKQVQEIHNCYETAMITYGLLGTVFEQKILCYDEIGVYQILTDRKEESIYPLFVEKTLGKLIEHDRQNDSDYMGLLKIFFENECNMTRTASALFFHKNTLKYKINAIKDILGYDITSNKNRVNIMLSLDILQMEEG
ncbi:MAG: PucR family transcriptional regulator ligand-binding domain-containing protein [Lachnoclostridium sp.]